MHLLHILGHGHQSRDGPERHSHIVGVKPGHDDAHSPVSKFLTHIDKTLVEELGLVHPHDLHVVSHGKHLGGLADRDGTDLVEIVRHDLHVGVALVDGRLEYGYLLVGELCTAQTADEFLRLAGEHGAADDFYAARFFVIFRKHCLDLQLG